MTAPAGPSGPAPGRSECCGAAVSISKDGFIVCGLCLSTTVLVVAEWKGDAR